MSFLLIWTTWFFYHQMPDATPEEIKKAYYSCMKVCHPDLSGDDPDVTNFCMFINEVYSVRATSQVFTFMYAACKMFSLCSEICHCTELTWGVEGQVLSDPAQRAVYDEIQVHSDSNKPFLWWQCTQGSSVCWWVYLHWYIDSSAVNRSFSFGSWVAQLIYLCGCTAAGCKNCANICPNVFQIEEDFGRSRVYSQSGSTELIQDAIDSWWDLSAWIYSVVTYFL